jgi:SAM-dependent methyltransferase
MAHPEQKDFFERLSVSFGKHFSEACKILEIGSQNINGTVRTFFPQASEYLGIDLGLADCVDWVVPGELLELPDGWADITISTECFEHCEAWEKVLKNMLRMTKPGGLVIFTCASTGRAAHGTIDSEEVSSPFTTSYYKNLDVDNIAEKTKLGAYFQRHGFEVNSRSSDLYFWGVRSESALAELENYWESPLDRLSRSQGQLAQAAARHASVQAQLDESRLQFAEAKTEAEQAEAQALQAKAEAEQAKAEAEKAKAEAEQAKAEAEKAKAEAEQAKAEAEQAKAEALQARDSLNEIVNSTSWKATGPFRKAAIFYKKSLGIF